MWDYSLHAVASRPAKVGEMLITTSFSGGTAALRRKAVGSRAGAPVWPGGPRPTPRLQPPPRRTQRADFPHCAPPFASRQSLWDLSSWGDFRPVASHSISVEQP
jgi:hypothetical protein